MTVKIDYLFISGEPPIGLDFDELKIFKYNRQNKKKDSSWFS